MGGVKYRASLNTHIPAAGRHGRRKESLHGLHGEETGGEGDQEEDGIITLHLCRCYVVSYAAASSASCVGG